MYRVALIYFLGQIVALSLGEQVNGAAEKQAGSFNDELCDQYGLNYVERGIYQFKIPFLFRQNNDETRKKFNEGWCMICCMENSYTEGSLVRDGDFLACKCLEFIENDEENHVKYDDGDVYKTALMEVAEIMVPDEPVKKEDPLEKFAKPLAKASEDIGNFLQNEGKHHLEEMAKPLAKASEDFGNFLQEQGKNHLDEATKNIGKFFQQQDKKNPLEDLAKPFADNVENFFKQFNAPK